MLTIHATHMHSVWIETSEQFWIEEEVSAVPKLHSFYFTFGSNPRFPFQGGYLIVRSEDEHSAREKFQRHYPNQHEDCLNCAFVYSEGEWERAWDPSKTLSKPGKCHRVIY